MRSDASRLQVNAIAAPNERTGFFSHACHINSALRPALTEKISIHCARGKFSKNPNKKTQTSSSLMSSLTCSRSAFSVCYESKGEEDGKENERRPQRRFEKFSPALWL